MITAVDTNILIDILEPDPIHGPASREMLRTCLREGALVACEVVWAEVATVYVHRQRELLSALDKLEIGFSAMSREAALLAAHAWHAWRGAGGRRERIVPDFLIGAHARLQCDRLLSRDRGFYRGYFNGLELLSP